MKYGQNVNVASMFFDFILIVQELDVVLPTGYKDIINTSQYNVMIMRPYNFVIVIPTILLQ